MYHNKGAILQRTSGYTFSKEGEGYVGIYLFFLSFKSVHGEIIIILKFIDKPD